jgi:hypothetical protein
MSLVDSLMNDARRQANVAVTTGLRSSREVVVGEAVMRAPVYGPVNGGGEGEGEGTNGNGTPWYKRPVVWLSVGATALGLGIIARVMRKR